MSRQQVAEPFASDTDFWASARASLAAFLTLALVTAGCLVLGPPAAIGFAVPVALLGYAARAARRSTGRTRAGFASRQEWRDAERRAVAQVMTGARRAG